MKPVTLLFDSLSALAGFSKTVHDRGYVAIVKDLIFHTNLTDAELQIALERHGAKLLPLNRVAA